MAVPGMEPVDVLAGIDPFTRIDPATLAAIRDELVLRRLEPGEVLVEAGSEARELAVVIDGSLGVDLVAADGTLTRIAELGAGSIVGEVAVLLGGRRTAAVVALAATTVVDLTAEGVGVLLAAAPELGAELTAQATRRLREAQLASHLALLFAGTPRHVLDEVARSIQHVTLAAGEHLFAEGDPADAAYVVLSGRLRAVRQGPDGRFEPVAEMAAGELVGELALLDGEARAADVLAVRDSALGRLPRAVFDRLVDEQPAAMLAITRRLVARTRAPRRDRTSTTQHRSIVVVPQSPDVDLRAFTRQLVQALGHGALHLSSTTVDRLLHRPGLAQSDAGAADDARLRHWLHEAEQQHRFLVYETDDTWTPWTERACRQADEVVIVAHAAAEDRSLGRLEEPLARSHTAANLPHRTLVLLHEPTVERATGTAAWLDGREVEGHHHVRLDQPRDLERLARILAGTATGLVLGGGGARGAAHLGVIRALREAGVAIDLYGGTSIGSVMALAGVLEWPNDGMVERVSHALWGLLDYTLPMVSLLKGQRITRAIADVADGRDIEDLWSDYFCISTNLTRQEEVVHRRGDLARAVRASVAIPGVLPPVPMGEDLLIDGASMNNLPVDRMREGNPLGPVIAVDVAPPSGPRAKADFEPVISGWGQLGARMLPGRRPLQVPGIAATMLGSTIVAAMRDRNTHVRDGLVDLYLDLDLRGHGLLDFEATTAIAEAGYETAAPRIEAWLAGRQEPVAPGAAPGSASPTAPRPVAAIAGPGSAR
jgi:predicted acylesterase/phospholipase RssA/CRP-like cAMP-binding protein